VEYPGARVLQRITVLEQPVEEVFDFFSRAENLELLTPPSLKFRIMTPLPIEMREGAIIDYRMRLNGVPMKWRSEITVWEPPHRFVDIQVRGPYILWVHEHLFVDLGGRTEMTDTVQYQVPGGLVEPLIHGLFVGPALCNIFDFRADAIRQALSASV
jgi:ligand-binding SRPBCC domain-containing protein